MNNKQDWTTKADWLTNTSEIKTSYRLTNENTILVAVGIVGSRNLITYESGITAVFKYLYDEGGAYLINSGENSFHKASPISKDYAELILTYA